MLVHNDCVDFVATIISKAPCRIMPTIQRVKIQNLSPNLASSLDLALLGNHLDYCNICSYMPMSKRPQYIRYPSPGGYPNYYIYAKNGGISFGNVCVDS